MSESADGLRSVYVVAGTYDKVLYGFRVGLDGQQTRFRSTFVHPAHLGCIKSVAISGNRVACAEQRPTLPSRRRRGWRWLQGTPYAMRREVPCLGVHR
jgi:hypothetical protein